MKTTSRLSFLAAVLLLIPVFFVPIWKITLEAPQYPEGLGMFIMVNTIQGLNPNDLNSINGLNHYIGMKKIEPESIPELVWMPKLLTGLIVFGLVAFFFGKRSLYLVWSILFLILLAVGFYDFYLWSYDYGHNLDPHAAIKVPGMTYQPPLLGSKQLLNITAWSLPGLGGVLLGLSLIIALFAWYKAGKESLTK